MSRVPILLVASCLLLGAPGASSAASIDPALRALEKGDYKGALDQLRPLATKGDADAQFYVGAMYERGAGVRQDPSEAIRWLRKSAAQRNTRAMGLLATTLFSRSRDDQDRVDAYAWSHLAAELDPIQAATSARTVIEKYCDSDQKKRGKAIMAEWKQKWSSEDKTRSSGR